MEGRRRSDPGFVSESMRMLSGAMRVPPPLMAASESFRTEVPITRHTNQLLGFDDPLLFLGSCFAEGCVGTFGCLDSTAVTGSYDPTATKHRASACRASGTWTASAV